MITILRRLGYNTLGQITLLEDNQSCIEYSKNNTSHDDTKHIEIKDHLMREQIQQETILVIKVPPAKENIADHLTKPRSFMLISSYKSQSKNGYAYDFVFEDFIYSNERLCPVLGCSCLFWEYLLLQDHVLHVCSDFPESSLVPLCVSWSNSHAVTIVRSFCIPVSWKASYRELLFLSYHWV